nr:hypothetical protein [Tanacetum cinerariifolium]
IPTASDEFPLPNYFPTASEDRFLLLSERDAHAEEVCTAPQEVADTGSTSEGSAKKKGRTVVVTTEDMHKRRNDVKARTTLLLALPDERQLRFSKYKTAQELWAAILKTFGGNEATKKTKKNQLKQQYGNFKAEGKETLEKTFNRLQAIRNRSDLDTTSLDDLYNHLKVYEPEVQKKSESNSQNMAFISSAKTSSGKEEVNTASFSTVITQVSPASADVATINEDDIEEIDIEWNMALLSMRADRFWKKTRKKITIQGWDWSYMDNEEENHALVADEEAPIEFALMAKSSSENKELEELKKEKEGLDSKLTGFQSAFKDLDTLLGSQRSDKNKEGLGYSTVPPPTQKGDSSKSIMSKPMIKFVKATNSTTEVKISKVETVRKPSVMYAEMYKNTTKSPKEEQGKTWPKNNNTHKSMSPRNIFHKTDRTPMRTNRPNMNVAQPKRTSFTKPAHSYVRRPFQRTSAARTQFKVPRVSTVNTKFPTVNKKIPLGNSQNVIDDKGYWDSGCSRHMTGNISYLLDYEPYDGGTPRQHNMYSIDLNNIVPHKDLTCLVTKASADESVLWHMRLGHLNFKTMNKLVRHNLVRGLPSRCFKNDHTCVACLKGKQHKASCKTKLVHSVSKPLHTLHMDLFGPTSVSSLKHKWYCLVVTDDFSRFTWTFFLKPKDETSGILRNFITEIENLKELKNRVAERRYRTLIEAARTMLADAKLPVTFWAEVVNTACYVQNRFLVNKSQNKTTYELFNGTTSTNFSGTKDAASQDVKKDVSSLRYIALLNWFHDAHLESSTSNAQDACNADALESSGNSNSIATSTNPPADQMETLAVETLIPTVSLPVPTAYLDLEPSSDTNGVEADLGNMENNISASPTLTFRIYKDHPKSQIIGPVDIAVQTRTKSKEMEEQSFIATIHHKTNPALLQFCLFSCFLSQEEPKKISDAIKDPSWVKAMQEELLQFKI